MSNRCQLWLANQWYHLWEPLGKNRRKYLYLRFDNRQKTQSSVLLGRKDGRAGQLGIRSFYQVFAAYYWSTLQSAFFQLFQRGTGRCNGTSAVRIWFQVVAQSLYRFRLTITFVLNVFKKLHELFPVPFLAIGNLNFLHPGQFKSLSQTSKRLVALFLLVKPICVCHVTDQNDEFSRNIAQVL